jgi:site-specific recombinase XerD
MSDSPKLFDRIHETFRLKHLSPRTEKSYLYYIKDFLRFHHMRHPRDLGADAIRQYLSYLAVEKQVAASTQNIALSALLFLYKQVLTIELPYIDNIERAKQPDRLPVVFTQEEVRQILAELEGLPHLVTRHDPKSSALRDPPRQNHKTRQLPHLPSFLRYSPAPKRL